ncbi:MAG: DUF975 family protein [Lachnospiraceae bacterium]
MWSRKELKTQAKSSIHSNYWKSILISILIVVFSGSVVVQFTSSMSGFETGSEYDTNSDNAESLDQIMSEPALEMGMVAAGILIVFVFLFVLIIIIGISMAVRILVVNPLLVGVTRFFVQNHGKKAQVSEVGYAFDHRYKTIIETMFYRDLFQFLWTLLLIVPGIVKAYEYRMINYILSDQPQLGRKEAFRMSKEMMHGQKWRAFVLDLSFLGWDLLSFFTFGLLSIFYVNPYRNQTNAELYLALKRSTDQEAHFMSEMNKQVM